MFRKLIFLVCITLVALAVGAGAPRYMNGDPEPYEPDTSCEDHIAEYQTAVQTCLDAATSLPEARACADAEH